MGAMARRILGFAAIVLAGYLGFVALLYASQRSFLYFPDTQRPALALARLPALQEATIATSDGLSLLGWYLPPPEAAPVVLHLHGNAGNIGHRAFLLRELARAGMGVLLLEYRGYGGNAGEPTETGLHHDARAALDFLRMQGIADNRIVVYGESLGTGAAVRLASEHPVGALVLESPYSSIVDLAAHTFPYVPVRLLLKDQFDSLARIKTVRAPLLVMQAAQDEIIPPELGRALFAAAPEPKEFWSSPQGGHNDLHRFGAGAAVIAFVRKHIAVP
jgi:fermentation-respiration switch protein FrsA (DUF1100 family)